MAVKSSVDVKAPRVKVETNQGQASASEGASAKNQAPAQKQVPAKKTATSAPKPRIDVAVAQDAAPASKPASAAKLATVTTSAPKSQVESTPKPEPKPAPKPATAKKPVSKPKVAMTVEPQIQEPQVEAPQPAQPAVAANAQDASEPSSSNADAASPKVPSGQRITEARRSVSGWVHNTFPGHEHAFWGGVVALLMSLMVFIIGPLRVLLICLLVFVGVAVGQVFDDDPKIIRAIQGLFDNDRDRA